MDPRWRMLFLTLLFSVAIATDASDDAAKVQPMKKADKEPFGEGKAKRSQEEIMFGNQQNKPAGLVDDLLVMPEGKDTPVPQEDSSSNMPVKNTTESQGEGAKMTESTTVDAHSAAESRPEPNGRYDYYEVMDEKGSSQFQDPSFDYTAPRPLSQVPNPDGLQTSQLYELQDLGEYPSYGYNNEVYRRKRTAIKRSPVRQNGKLRSLPMGKSHRRCRVFGCPPRPKRQVSVEDLLSLLGTMENNDRYYANDEYPQVPDKFLLPVEVSDSVNYDLPYPYPLAGGETAEDDEVMLPSDSYPRTPPNYEVRMPPLQREREELERIPVPDWMMRVPPPSVTNSVTRRTAPYLYPQDYRFVPGHKKRSRDSRPLLEHWGRPVQVPEAYASEEDVARLYALAKLLAEAEDME